MMKRSTILLLCALPALVAILVSIYSCATSPRMDITPGKQLVTGADFVGKQTCAMCHSRIVENFKSTVHGRHQQLPVMDNNGLDRICESCHGAGSLHLEVGGGRDANIIDPGETPAPCFQCHQNIQARVVQRYSHPIRKGKMSCTDCHSPHSKDIFLPSGTLMGGSSPVCRQCHREKAAPRVFEHEALREGCTSCHNPHGTINEKMLVQRDNNLCLRCHGQISSAGSINMGDFSHTSRLAEGVCWSSGCHTAVHGSNINPHLRY